MVATVEQLAALVRGRLVGDGTVSIHSARPVAEAGPGTSPSSRASGTPSSCGPRPPRPRSSGPHFNRKRPTVKDDLTVIEVDDPITAFVAVRRHLAGEQQTRWTGIHPQACVAPSARIGENVADLSVRLRGRRGRDRRGDDPVSRAW